MCTYLNSYLYNKKNKNKNRFKNERQDRAEFSHVARGAWVGRAHLKFTLTQGCPPEIQNIIILPIIKNLIVHIEINKYCDYTITI